MTEFSKGLRLNLPDAFPSYIEILTYFFKCSFMSAVVQTEAQANHAFFARTQSLQNVARDFSQVRSYHSGRWTFARLVFNQVPKLGITVFANGGFQRNRILHKFACLAHFVDRSVHLLGDLFGRWFTSQFTHEFTRSVLQFIDHFNHVNWNANRSRLIGNCTCDSLTNPPGSIS